VLQPTSLQKKEGLHFLPRQRSRSRCRRQRIPLTLAGQLDDGLGDNQGASVLTVDLTKLPKRTSFVRNSCRPAFRLADLTYKGGSGLFSARISGSGQGFPHHKGTSLGAMVCLVSAIACRHLTTLCLPVIAWTRMLGCCGRQSRCAHRHRHHGLLGG
jgi:hypothetical protein